MSERPVPDWLAEEIFRFAMQRRLVPLLITNVTGKSSVKKIMEELRAEDPEAAMLLGEYVVVEDES